MTVVQYPAGIDDVERCMREPEGFSRLATVGPSQLTLSCDDDFRLEATCFEAAGTPRAIIVVASALGVPRRTYQRFGEFMAAQGVACLTFDYRGIGESVPSEGQESLVDMERWGRQDIDAAIRGAASLYPGTPIFLLGHSCGAQLFGLAPASKRLSGAIMVAPSLPHASRYPLPDRYALRFMWRVVVPLLGRGAAYKSMTVPGMRGAVAPKAVFKQWARWCCSREYLFDAKFKIDTTSYSMLNLPLLVISVSDDEQAPAMAADALIKFFPQAEVERRVVDVQRLGFGSLGHMGFFRSKTRDALWFPLMAWMGRHRDRKVI